MSSEFDKNLEKYADVILKVGLNLQKGQRLLIIQGVFASFPLELAPFVEILVRKAYQMGVRFVEVIWEHPKINLIRLQNAPRNSLQEFPIWRRDAVLEFMEKGDALLAFLAFNPDLFADVDPKLIDIIRRTALKHNKPINELISRNAVNWTVIAAPVEGWVDKIFPDLPSDMQKAKLWEVIFDICRVKQKDPVSAWNDHIDQIHARVNYLNYKQFNALKLEAPGTDLTIGLPKNHIWQGGSEKSQNGIKFVANIPTEEIFTMPHKDKTEGIVTSTKPLYYAGARIEDFKLTFSKGKVTEAIAANGQEFLEQFINTDEGASRLGEIALVPHSSPISQSGLLFYNSLIDENASCHVALGRVYRPCLENGEKMSDDELVAAGGNVSLTHIDFMIGSGEMDIDGITKDGKAEPIMRMGEWAFEI